MPVAVSEISDTCREVVLGKMADLERRLEGLNSQLSDPEVTSRPDRLADLVRQQGQLARLLRPYQEHKALAERMEQARSLLADAELDPDMRELAAQEEGECRRRDEELMEEMTRLLVMADDQGVSSVILEIRAGTGGEEAALFARDLYEMYTKYAAAKGYQMEVLSFVPTDRGGFREVIASVKGEGVWAQFGYEGGGHRVQRVPVTEAQGRIHTSAATVAVLPEPAELDVRIAPEDVIEHVSRAGGPGGQNVNKVSSAIRLEHVPTGITVSMRDEKSQHRNRAKAWRVLRSRVFEHHAQHARQQRAQARRKMIGSGDRSERIRTYNFPQNRCTDHRINLDLYSLDRVLDGDLDELIAALQEHDRRERILALEVA